MRILKEDLIGRSPDNVIGSGRITLEENDPSQRTVIDLDQLERTIKIIKDLGWESVAIRVQNNYPILLSQIGEDEQDLIGFIIAPLVSTE